MEIPSWPEIYPTLNQPDHAAHLDWTFECGAPSCRWITYHRTEKGARAEKDRHHANDLCPYEHRQMQFNKDEGGLVPAGKSIIEKFWEQLDRVTKEIMVQRPRFQAGEMTPEENDGYCKLQGQAQGIAIAIQIISVPHFEDAGAVARWALKRYRMDRGEAEFMDTPGCKGYNPMPPPTREITRTTKRPAKAATGPAADPKTGKFRALSDEDRQHLREMLGKGIPGAAIMGMLKLTPEQFEHERTKVSA